MLRPPEQIRICLKHYNLRAVARETNLHYATLYDFVNKNVDPRASTLMALNDFIDREASNHGTNN